MWWVARENWPWLLLAAVLGAVVSTVLTLRRTPEVEADPDPATPAPTESTPVEPAPVEEASVEPAPADPAPEEPPHPVAVKARRASMLFHTEDSPNWSRVRADEVFASEAEARDAGYHRWDDPDRPR